MNLHRTSTLFREADKLERNKMKRIGILGGTFNPVHKGHLRIAEIALKEFKLDKVVFIPSGIPPHKPKAGIAPKEDRFRMIEIAIKPFKKFVASRIELDRPGYSYAVDTFNDLKRDFGKRAHLYYIMGLDSINDILSWKKPLELFKMCKFIVATRPGAKIRSLKRLMKFPPLKINADKIDIVETKFDISSSEIREDVKAGRSIVRRVPKEVVEYINRKGLYN